MSDWVKTKSGGPSHKRWWRFEVAYETRTSCSKSVRQNSGRGPAAATAVAVCSNRGRPFSVFIRWNRLRRSERARPLHGKRKLSYVLRVLRIAPPTAVTGPDRATPAPMTHQRVVGIGAVVRSGTHYGVRIKPITRSLFRLDAYDAGTLQRRRHSRGSLSLPSWCQLPNRNRRQIGPYLMSPSFHTPLFST